MYEQSTSQAQSTITQSPTSIQVTTEPTTTTTAEIATTTMPEQSTLTQSPTLLELTTTVYATPASTVNPTTTAEIFSSNSYTFGIYNVSWTPRADYVDFSFTVNVPSNSLTNFWAAFAFSTDNNMVSNHFFVII
jgi:hypothetical protein